LWARVLCGRVVGNREVINVPVNRCVCGEPSSSCGLHARHAVTWQAFGLHLGLQLTTFSHRVASHSPFRSIEWRIETGLIAKLKQRVLVQNSFLGFCYLQGTDTSMLSAPKPDRGFESTSLRHAVWTAEKPRCIPPKTASKSRDFAIPAIKRDRRECIPGACWQVFHSFSLEGSPAVLSTNPPGECNAITIR